MLEFSAPPQTLPPSLLKGQSLVTKVVAPVGGDYTTLGAALTVASPGDVIYIKPGTYNELAAAPSVANLTIIGSGHESTILSFGANNFTPSGAGMLIQGVQFTFTTGRWLPSGNKSRYFNNAFYQTDTATTNTFISPSGLYVFANNYVNSVSTGAGEKASFGGVGSQILNNNFTLPGGIASGLMSAYSASMSFSNNYIVLSNSGSNTGSFAALTISSASGVVANNIFNNAATSSDVRAIWCTSATTVSGNTTRAFWTGIHVSSGASNITGNHIVVNSTSGIAGISISSQNTTVTGNYLEGPNGGTSSAGVLISTSNATVTGNAITSFYNNITVSGSDASIAGNALRAPVNKNINMVVHTNHQIQTNYGASINEERSVVYMKNTSGSTINAGNIVTFKSVAAGDEVTTTTTGGDSKVFGMACAAISNNAYGFIQVAGKTTILTADGTTDIAIGDFLSAFTTAGIVKKASAGETAIAIALEAYTADASSGVLDALIITPRLI